jgi:predicted nucleotidyltransferase component of viral defense system
MTNSIASIKSRLTNIAQKEKQTYQLILIRYFTERLIYRLSISDFKNHFCLKGGALLYAFEQETSRPTMDLDLLGLHIANEQLKLKTVFQTISQIACEADSVIFLSDTITTSEIKKEGRYSGIRLKIEGRLGNIRQMLQIDIGFGDIVTPAPVEMTYPTLLPMPSPQIMAYSIETVIAEKFEAMINLAAQNTRMKDFYDVFRLLQKDKYREDVLINAISNTFQHRATRFVKNPVVFTQDFAENAKRHLQWNAFLRKMNKHATFEDIDFRTVMAVIIERLKPIYDKFGD